MVVYYLFTALLLNGNKPAFALPVTFNNQAACEDAGLAFATQAKNDPTVDRAVWNCFRIDFETADPRA